MPLCPFLASTLVLYKHRHTIYTYTLQTNGSTNTSALFFLTLLGDSARGRYQTLYHVCTYICINYMNTSRYNVETAIGIDNSVKTGKKCVFGGFYKI